MKLNRFWKVYFICLTAVACLLACGFSVFYQFIESYEQSQPEFAAQQYADRLTDAAMSDALLSAIPDELSPYETVDEIHAEILRVYKSLNGGMNVVKNYKNYTSTRPAFYIKRGDNTVAEIILTSEKTGAFGMTRWNVLSITGVLEGWAPTAKDYTLYVPEGAQLSLGDSLIPKENTTTVPYGFASIYEPDADASWTTYTISGLYNEPKFTCQLDGEVCTSQVDGTVIKYFYPDSHTQTYTVTAPNGSDVTVNGVLLKEEHVTQSGIRYDYNEIETSLETLPTAVTYTLEGLFAPPSVSVSLDGAPLPCNEDGGGYVAEYPRDLLYDCTIYVPVGSTVSIYGKEYAAENSQKTAAFPELARFLPTMPQYDVYTLKGLYASPADSISVTLNGDTMPLTTVADGRTVTCRAAYPSSDNKTVTVHALEFAEDYITYTAQGYRNLDQNLATVLAHVRYGTDTYSRILNSKYGIYYVTPVTSNVYKKLEVSSIMKYTDDIYQCTVDFEVDQDTYYIHNEYVGTFTLLIAKYNNAWLVYDMYLDTK